MNVVAYKYMVNCILRCDTYERYCTHCPGLPGHHQMFSAHAWRACIFVHLELCKLQTFAWQVELYNLLRGQLMDHAMMVDGKWDIEKGQACFMVAVGHHSNLPVASRILYGESKRHGDNPVFETHSSSGKSKKSGVAGNISINAAVHDIVHHNAYNCYWDGTVSSMETVLFAELLTGFLTVNSRTRFIIDKDNGMNALLGVVATVALGMNYKNSRRSQENPTVNNPKTSHTTIRCSCLYGTPPGRPGRQRQISAGTGGAEGREKTSEAVQKSGCSTAAAGANHDGGPEPRD